MRRISSPKRPYDSAKRRASAQQTRVRIAQSGRALFAQLGYGATSIEAIAKHAGVAVPTFYATYGSKRGLLFALLDAADAQANVVALQDSVRGAAADPGRQLSLMVSFNRRLYQQSADLIEVARSAGSTEPDLAALWVEGEQRRLRGVAPVVHSWAVAGALRKPLSERDALDILWSMMGPDNYRLFVSERGWSPEKYEKWLTATLRRLLLREAPSRLSHQ
jgi:TetR/AcrR family transcriptional regulator, regulator of cefoperazone and chloramphenicol sensitivity